MTKKIIKHNRNAHRFELTIDSHTGYLEYMLKDGVIDMTHTIVPQQIGGQGVATDLVKFALAYCRVEHLKVIPTCSFVSAFIAKHAVYHDLLYNKTEIS